MADRHISDEERQALFRALGRYARDNPLAMLAGAAILGVLLARFAFLGNPRD